MSCTFSSKLYKETDILQPQFISILQRLMVKLSASVVHKRLSRTLKLVFNEIILEFQAVYALYLLLLMKMSTELNFYFKVLHDGGAVKAERYFQFLEAAIKLLSQKLNVPGSQLSIMHDNARPHVAQIVKSWMCEKGVNCIMQPAYSPDFNLMDRYVF